VKVVMTLLVRDEADIVDDQIRFHLDQGVDFVVATDHRSVDGTTDVLRRYEREGLLHLIREEGEGIHQAEWVTRMARLAATDFGADWVINSDGDEFWWPREGSLHEVLAAVPSRFGAVRGLWRHFVLRPDGPGPFFERMTVRRWPSDDWSSPYHAQVKVAHRADPRVVVSKGNHDAFGERLVLLREWFPFEVLHFPVRSRSQLSQKYGAAAAAGRIGEGDRLPRHIEVLSTGLEVGEGGGVYEELVVDDERVEAGLRDGSLTVDTRVRDVLRGQASEPDAWVRPSLADDVAFAEEIDALHAHDAATKLTARVHAAERRLSTLEAMRLSARGRVLEPRQPLE
jgi:hypothetical protein